MHEYPITQQIIKICTKHCEEAKAKKVTRVKLVVGETSGFIGESIQMYFDVISEGTPCEGAKLDIVRVKPNFCRVKAGCCHIFLRSARETRINTSAAILKNWFGCCGQRSGIGRDGRMRLCLFRKISDGW